MHQGFYYRNGEYTTIMFPGHPGAIAQRITSDGEIFGCLHDHNLTKRHGFLQPADGSAPQTLDVSFVDETCTTITAFATIAFGINPSGLIVGQYTLVANGAPHGFVAFPPGRQ